MSPQRTSPPRAEAVTASSLRHPELVCKIYLEYWQDGRPGPGPVQGAWIWCEADGGGTGLGSLRASTCPTFDTRHGLSVIADVRDLTREDEAGR